MSDPELARACEIVAHKDVQPLRRALFARLESRRPSVRAAVATWQRLGNGRRAAAFVASLAVKRFFEVRFPDTKADLLAVDRYENERRQFAALSALDGSLRIARIALEPTPARGVLSLATGWELLREYATRGDFLVAARVAETIGYYSRMLPGLAAHGAPAVLVSSDTNPYALALVHAARRLGKKTCFVTHGHVAEDPPPLDFDLSLVDGVAVREVYERAGPIRGKVVLKGSEGIARPMNVERLSGGVRTLGIVLSILVDWERVGKLLSRLREELRPQHVVLRLHPNRTMRDAAWAESIDLRGVRVSLGEQPLVEDVAGCDLVVAGNTSAHLTILKLGVPTLQVPGLDQLAPDYYGFVRDGIVAPAGAGFDAGAIAGFYSAPEWARRFERFDAGYPNRQADCDRDVVAALRELSS